MILITGDPDIVLTFYFIVHQSDTIITKLRVAKEVQKENTQFLLVDVQRYHIISLKLASLSCELSNQYS